MALLETPVKNEHADLEPVLDATSTLHNAGKASESAQTENNAENGDDYDEEEDEDFDPNAVVAEKDDSDSETEDYSAISAPTTQVRTRTQRYQEKQEAKSTNIVGEVSKDLDLDSLFSDLKQKSLSTEQRDWNEIWDVPQTDVAENDKKTAPISIELETLGENKVWIKTSYTFAGKVITESKQVDADSAEAQAYLNSAAGLQFDGEQAKNRSFVPIIRTVKGYEEPLELRIKLKRPSLIDRFLATQGNKHQKLLTLEKSRLDWAVFVDKNKINDDLKLHNKDGYLEKQDFLGRLQAKQDEAYASAREADRARRWQEQQL